MGRAAELVSVGGKEPTRRRRPRDPAGPGCPSLQGRGEGRGCRSKVHSPGLSRESLLMAGSSSERQVISRLRGTREGRKSGAVITVAMRFVQWQRLREEDKTCKLCLALREKTKRGENEKIRGRRFTRLRTVRPGEVITADEVCSQEPKITLTSTKPGPVQATN